MNLWSIIWQIKVIFNHVNVSCSYTFSFHNRSSRLPFPPFPSFPLPPPPSPSAPLLVIRMCFGKLFVSEFCREFKQSFVRMVAEGS